MNPILILTLALSASASGTGGIAEDVAIDAITGDTLVVQARGNRKGELLVLNDRDLESKRTLRLPRGSRYEVEMTGDDQALYLVQGEGFWAVGRLVKGAKGWAAASLKSAIGGEGEAGDLHALPDGNAMVQVQGEDGVDTLVIGVTDGKLAELDRVPSDAVAEAIETAKEVFTNDEDDKKKYDSGNGLGFAAGIQSGIGLAYRRHFESKWGFQVAAGGWGDADNVDLDLGATLMRTLSKTEVVRFYALAGASAFYSYSSWEKWTCPTKEDGTPEECYEDGRESQSATRLNFGLGIGIEFRLLKRIGLAAELPVTVQTAVAGTEGTGFKGIYMIPNGALVYYF